MWAMGKECQKQSFGGPLPYVGVIAFFFSGGMVWELDLEVSSAGLI